MLGHATKGKDQIIAWAWVTQVVGEFPVVNEEVGVVAVEDGRVLEAVHEEVWVVAVEDRRVLEVLAVVVIEGAPVVIGGGGLIEYDLLTFFLIQMVDRIWMVNVCSYYSEHLLFYCLYTLMFSCLLLTILILLDMASSGSMSRPPCVDQDDMPNKQMWVSLDKITEKDVKIPTCWCEDECVVRVSKDRKKAWTEGRRFFVCPSYAYDWKHPNIVGHDRSPVC